MKKKNWKDTLAWLGEKLSFSKLDMDEDEEEDEERPSRFSLNNPFGRDGSCRKVIRSSGWSAAAVRSDTGVSFWHRSL